MNTLALYRPMMTLFRETTTSRTNLTIELCCKSIITMFENVVKNFILSLVVVALLTNAIYVLLCLNTKEKYK
jgi:hypothetical protein